MQRRYDRVAIDGAVHYRTQRRRTLCGLTDDGESLPHAEVTCEMCRSEEVRLFDIEWRKGQAKTGE